MEYDSEDDNDNDNEKSYKDTDNNTLVADDDVDDDDDEEYVHKPRSNSTCSDDIDDTNIGEDYEMDDVANFDATSIASSLGNVFAANDSEEPDPGIQGSGIHGSKIVVGKKHNTSFFADSPYYDAFVAEEMDSLKLATETLQDICEQTKVFAEAGTLMAEATRKLASSCQLRSSSSSSSVSSSIHEKSESEKSGERERKREALGSHLTSVFQRIGEMLTKIASVQEHMCNIVETKLGSHIEDVTSKQIEEFSSLKEDVEKQADTAEHLFFNYLNGSNAGGNLVNQTSLKNNARAHRDLLYGHSFNNDSFNHNSNNQHDTSYLNNDIDNNDDDIDDDNTIMAKEWANTMGSVRMEQGVAEFKRIVLYKHIVDDRYRRTYVVTQAAEGFCKELHSSYALCSDITKSTTARVQKNRRKAKKMLLHNQDHMKSIWREEELRKTLANLSSVEFSASLTAATAQGQDQGNSTTPRSQTADGKLSLLETVESGIGIWEMPTSVATTLPYNRELPAGVLLEGWLYERQKQDPEQQLMEQSQNQPQVPPTIFGLFNRKKQKAIPESGPCYTWQKRWCMLKNDGLFCLQQKNLNSPDGGKDKESFIDGECVEEMGGLCIRKMCDINTCDVRKLPHNPSERFCFEIVVSPRRQSSFRKLALSGTKEKTIIFQARGPNDLSMWVDGVQYTSAANR